MLLCAGCGDLESDRICLNNPCPEQPKVCKDYVACYYLTGGNVGSLDSTYGRTGACWSNGGAVASCTASCGAALPSLKESFPDAGCN